ncbi:28 kDa outer membrane protein [Bacteroidales bacterium Barb7]|nr:28 kDa outer membrane protein [Bacteroidales bacterium Barb7]
MAKKTASLQHRTYFLYVALFLLAPLSVLTSCGAKTQKEGESEKKTILIGIGPNPTYAIMCQRAIQPILEKKGYTLEYKKIGDALITNVSLADNDIDLNIGQHEAYLEYTKKHKQVDVSPLIIIPSAVDGIYSQKLKAKNREELVKELKPGDVITVPYDPSNQSRTLCFLEDLGLFKLKPGIIRGEALLADIVENVSGIVVRPIDEGLIPRTLSEVTAGIISGQEAEYAGIFDQAIVREIITPAELQIIYAIKTSNLDTQWAKDFVDAVQSEEFRNVIEDPQYSYHRYVKPAWYVEKWRLPSNQ